MALNATKNYANRIETSIPQIPIERIRNIISSAAVSTAIARAKAKNRLLNKLSPALYARLEPLMQRVFMRRGETIYEVGSPINHLYFPEDLIASRLALMEDGSMIEVGMTGSEGVLGVRALLGAGKTEYLTLAETDGAALRIEAPTLKHFFHYSAELQNVCLRFYENFLGQIAQKAACRCRHTIFRQLASWLLQFQERAAAPEISLTQETIAHRLGARRSSITVAMHELERKSIISCGRGNIEILDAAALAGEACECFSMMKGEREEPDFFEKYVH